MRATRHVPALALLIALAAVQAAPARAQALRTEYEGPTALGLELRRLGTAKRVLMIAAHPDDERTEILTTLALGAGAEVAYLSLTRGEGGQNLIGPELQEGLGLIRTEELLAARRLDGARQFFSRAYDYGFSKNAAEAFRHWPHDQVLADVVAVIRSYRPDIVVAVFSGTPADGHGQHQASGILAREAFAAAGDPDRFPEQIAAGLKPFAPARLFQGGWRGDDGAGLTAEIAPGRVDPLLGKSYARVAGESRSRHLSQGFGNAGSRQGSQTLAMPFISGEPLPRSGAGPFAGLDTALSVRAAHAGSTPRLATLLRDYEQRVGDAVSAFDAGHLEAVLAPLAGAVRVLAAVDSAALPPNLHTALAAERAEAADALWRAAKLQLVASAPTETIVPGQAFVLTLEVRNGGDEPRIVQSLEPDLPSGWKVEPLDRLSGALPARGTITRRFRVTVPADAPVTEPYFLRAPRRGDMYVWPAGVRVGVPFEQPPVRASARAAIAGAVATIRTDALVPASGAPADAERRTVRVVPAVSVLADPALAVLPLGAAPRGERSLHLTVHLRPEGPRPVAGTLQFHLPEGWQAAPASVRLNLAPGQSRDVEVTVRPPASVAAGESTIMATFRDASGAEFARGYTLIDYPHIRPQPLYRPAGTRVRAFQVALPQDLRVGYVAGVGDDAPAALRQMGAQVTELSPEDLASGDLDRFQAIVIGIRAYEVRPDLLKNNERLLDFARAGGTLVVQYNRFERVREPFTPYPLTARLQDRVTDETARVRILAPGHQALTWPNRITQADFEGWVQERGLYYPTAIDEHFTALLEMGDPGDPPLRGGLLVAPLGRGTYVYTGLALFRQFPEGVPGAYRILANLVSLGVKR